jgi:hypothetical protein
MNPMSGAAWKPALLLVASVVALDDRAVLLRIGK